MMDFINKQNKYVVFMVAAVALLILPLILQTQGNAWVRIADTALLYVLLALGLIQKTANLSISQYFYNQIVKSILQLIILTNK